MRTCAVMAVLVPKRRRTPGSFLVRPSYRVHTVAEVQSIRTSRIATQFHSQFEFGCEIVPVYVPVAVPAHRSNCVEIVPLPVALANAPAPPVMV